MDRYESALAQLRQNAQTWLITGVAGFIGSHLLECLLGLGQAVVGLDNFSTGHPKNIDEAMESGNVDARFRLIYGDARELSVCQEACDGVDIVLHHAALASVPGSLADPLAFHAANVDGFVNILVAAKNANVKRVVYASSSAVYGDDAGSPKREERIGQPLSPYALTKLTNEIYAAAFKGIYGVQTVGLRYFNVFGSRQDPQGAYAAVIPRWISCIGAGQKCLVLGDGETSRDFVHVDDAVQANLLAATVPSESLTERAYNVGSGVATTLNDLYSTLREEMFHRRRLDAGDPVYADFRPGDIRYSLADLTRIRQDLGFQPTTTLADGLGESLGWYLAMDTPPRGQRQMSNIGDIPPGLTIVPPDDG